jgi:hypothetical protein
MNAKKPPSELFHQLFCNKGPPKQKNRKLPEKPVKVRSPKISIIIEPEFMQVGVWFFKPQCRSIGIMYQSRIIGTIIKKLIGVKPVLTKPPPISINDLHDIPGRFKKCNFLKKKHIQQILILKSQMFFIFIDQGSYFFKNGFFPYFPKIQQQNSGIEILAVAGQIE